MGYPRIKQHLFCNSRFSEAYHLASMFTLNRSVSQSSLIPLPTAGERTRLRNGRSGKERAFTRSHINRINGCSRTISTHPAGLE